MLAARAWSRAIVRSHVSLVCTAGDDMIMESNGFSEFSLKENRYEMYVKLLKEGVKELLTAKDGDAALKKSQSSPSLNQDSQPATAKVKRNTSERKDYRPETPKVT